MSNYPRVSIPNTELRTIASSHVGEEYQIYVSLPIRYHSSSKRYPVLYLLDADHLFPVAQGLVRPLECQEGIPELIVVGIAYGKLIWEGTNPRVRDYSPTFVENYRVPTGGGERFFKFLNEELIPFIDDNYRTQPDDRSIFGHSIGGCFVLYSLFRDDNPFYRHIASSASPTWDNRWIFKHEAAFSNNHTELKAKLYLSEDNTDPPSIAGWRDLVETLEQRQYTGLDFSSRFYEHEGHNTVRPYSLTDGLRFIFSDIPPCKPQWLT
ncbi:MAG: alpha/beta hydrolase [Sedimentisphaerales bacterium]|nr:alpha/beta hydrolase [Sedimentisphaerales bacterium]